MTREEIEKLVGDFTWMWNDKFYISTDKGNFIWSDPSYNGDNSLVKYEGNLEKLCKERGVPYGRNKGRHVIKDYIKS